MYLIKLMTMEIFEMENIYILVHRINSDNKSKYDKIYNAIKNNVEIYSSLFNILEETSTIYYKTTTEKNIDFITNIKLHLRENDAVTIINLSKEQIIFWDKNKFKQSTKYSYLLHQ